METLPGNWKSFLAPHVDFAALEIVLARVAKRRGEVKVFPPEGAIFTAFELTPPENVRVVIIGQDPYHDDGQAQGLAFSVADGVKIPPSLRNIYKEFAADLGAPPPETGNLTAWAEHGVLLLNAVLSVDAHAAASHRNYGWEFFTDRVIAALSEFSHHRLAFILWGNFAQKKASLINAERHLVLTGAHPSPLSAHRGFFDSRPFSAVENALAPWRWPRGEELFR